MKQAKITGIIPFSYIVKKRSGSSILRAEVLAQCSDDFKIWQHGPQYDALIFQKVYWLEMMQNFKGPKILDLCDPDWVKGDVDIIETGNLVDAITCSSPALTKLLRSYLPEKIIEYVPDRFNFNLFPPPRKHTRNASKVIWFGFVHNAHETLPTFADALRKHNLELTIISDLPYSQKDSISDLHPRHITYEEYSAYDFIQQGDIVLNPKSTKAFFKYKSNNKDVIAWRLGMPVAQTPADLERLLTPDNRNNEINEKIPLVENEYNITRSANQYREIINQIIRTT